MSADDVGPHPHLHRLHHSHPLRLLLRAKVSVQQACSVFSSLIFHLRQIRDSNKLSDFREDHNLTEDQGIPWHLLKHFNNNITRPK